MRGEQAPSRRLTSRLGERASVCRHEPPDRPTIRRGSELLYYSMLAGMRYVAEMNALRLLDEVEPAGIAAQSI